MEAGRAGGRVTTVLLYHDVVPADERDASGFPGPLAARYKLDPGLFEAHLAAVSATGIGVGVLAPGEGLPPAAFTFDDGGASSLAAAELLERCGWRGHFFIASAFIGRQGFLGAAELRSLAERGHVVGSHSHSHPTYMGRLDPEAIEREWTESRARLADVLGEPPLLASLPGGFLSRSVLAGAARAGYRMLMTSEPSTRPRSSDGLLAVGRFAIWSTTPASRAAAYVAGSRWARSQLWLEWHAKDTAKRISPAAYQALRKVRARRA
ncbi:MAG TPA: polysaccharide deacetylase family protein [Gaiellaceae bacterium]|nr:polysaccharide deacetylase family protein [Gaiellaceae bacterium]